MSTAGPLLRHRFETLADASAALAEAVAVRLRTCVDERGRALLAVPGGTTPAGFLAALGRHDLAWEQVTLLPTDERFVAADDAASNERMIRAQFAPLIAGRASFLSFHEHGSDIEAAAALLGAKLAELPPIDLLVSGMGADGHVASLFPNTDPRVDDPLRLRRLTPDPLPPEAPFDRLSLTLPALLDSDEIVLVIRGATKHALFEAAAAGANDLPVARLLAAASQPVTCFT